MAEVFGVMSFYNKNDRSVTENERATGKVDSNSQGNAACRKINGR